MKIVICGSMSASKQMVDIKKFLEEQEHEVMIPIKKGRNKRGRRN